MNSTVFKTSLLLFISIFSLCRFAKADEAIEAKEILNLYKLNRGVVITLGNITLAIELAKLSDLRVYCCIENSTEIDKARELVNKSGLSSLRVRIEKGPLNTLAYPKLVANIFLCDSKLDPIQLNEISRLLRPDGYLFLKKAKEDIGLSAMKNFFAKNDPTNWKEPIKVGENYCVQKSLLAGAADWGHYYREPNNNRYSPDKLIKAPLRLLWYGEPIAPLGDLFLTQGFSAGGRLYLTDASPNDTSRARITCLDAFNGTQLWVREVGGSRYEKMEGAKKDDDVRVLQLPGWVQPGSMAVSSEKIYLADNAECLVLDAVTGKDIIQFKAPAPTDAKNHWRYVAYQDDLLIGFTNATTPIPVRNQPLLPSEGGAPSLFAINKNSGDKIWVRVGSETDELGIKFSRPLAIGEKTIFVKSERSLIALDLNTGKTKWKNDNLDEMNNDLWWEGTISDGQFVLSKFNIRGWSDKTKKLATQTFSVKDGSLVNQVAGDLTQEVFFNSKTSFLGAPPNPRLGCNYGSGAGNLFFYRNGYFVEKENTIITSPNNSKSYGGFRAGCGVGALPANGLVHLLPNGLGCECAALRGTATFESNPDGDVPISKFEPKIEVLNSLASENEKQATKNDWPTYNGDGYRSAVTTQDFSKPYTTVWENKITGKPTPCIAVGNQVFLGSTDETIYSFDGLNGKLLWKFHTTGAIQTAPAYWNGRVFAGSDDGWLYALSAKEGKLLWKFYGGPSLRKNINFESLISPWPIRQGIAVDQGQVFLTAGLIPGDEIYVYSIDAVTGSVNWKVPVGKTNIIPCGYLTLRPNDIFIPSPGSAAIYHPVILGKKNGVRQKSWVTHGDFTEVRYIPALDFNEIGYNQGFMLHGGSKGKVRGYRDGAGYSGKKWSYDSAYSLFSDFYDEGKTKIKPFNPMGDGHSFPPVFVKDIIIMRFKNSLVTIKQSDLFKFLETRELKGNEKEQFYFWSIKELPCGVIRWVIAGTNDKNAGSTTILVGGDKGLSAVNAVDGKILWNTSNDGESLPAAIANERIYYSTNDGFVRGLQAK